MSKIKNGGLDQYGAEPFEQQQFGTAGVEGVNQQKQPPMPRPVYTIQQSNNVGWFKNYYQLVGGSDV